MRIIIVSENASEKFGGEAILPLHYYRYLRERGHEMYLVVHSRNKIELQKLFPDENNIEYVNDTYFHQWMYKLGKLLPNRLEYFTTGYALRFSSQWVQKNLVKKLIKKNNIELVHQPIPVSPREPSLMYGLGAPVIIGPMNGGMGYPPAFQDQKSKLVDSLIKYTRILAIFINILLPGKRRAALLMVANKRTRDALPSGCSKNIIELVENGVDMKIWTGSVSNKRAAATVNTVNTVNFLYTGRLVDWKGVDLLLIAFLKVKSKDPNIKLVIVGDGPELAKLKNYCCVNNILDEIAPSCGKVFFAGWKTQVECADYLFESDVFILPSLLECGGAVVLEAMAAGKPVIATDWGGPADYLDNTCGILVAPVSREKFISGLFDAMVLLAESEDLRLKLGKAAHNKVKKYFDWDKKVNLIEDIYRNIIDSNQGANNAFLKK